METVHLYRYYESKQITLLDAFNFEKTYDAESEQLQINSLYVKYDPTEWYWDKRLWTIELINRMFDMKEDESQCFGIEEGDKIKASLEIAPEKSYKIISYKLDEDTEESEHVSMTLDKLVKGQTDGRDIGCNIHKNWKKYGLYELILRRCKYDAIQKTVIGIYNDYEVKKQ